jgi:prevent-host-death family protein
MATKISSSEAKIKWSEVLRRIADQGESFIITHRGQEVADIRPRVRPKMTVKEAVERMQRRWEEGRTKNPNPRDFVPRSELHEGHKY